VRQFPERQVHDGDALDTQAIQVEMAVDGERAGTGIHERLVQPLPFV